MELEALEETLRVGLHLGGRETRATEQRLHLGRETLELAGRVVEADVRRARHRHRSTDTGVSFGLLLLLAAENRRRLHEADDVGCRSHGDRRVCLGV